MPLGMADAGLNGKKLEFLGIDACLMMGPESIHPVRDLARTYIACAEIDYGRGWNYQDFFTYLAANRSASIQDIARREVALWDAWHNVTTASPAERLSRSHAAIDLGQWKPFAEAYTTMVDAMKNDTALEWIEVARATWRDRPDYWSPIESGSQTPIYLDLGTLLQRWSSITSSPSRASQAAGVRNLFGNVMLASAQGTMRKGSHQSGMQIEFASSRLYHDDANRLADYRNTAWSQATRAGDLLGAVLAHRDESKPQATFSLNEKSEQVEVVTYCSEIDVADGELRLYQHTTNGDFLAFGVLGHGEMIPNRAYGLNWQRDQLTVADKTAASPCYFMVWVSAGADSIYAVPGYVGIDSRQIPVLLLVGSRDQTANQIVVTDDNRSVTDVLRAGWTFTPILYRVGDEVKEELQTRLTVPDSGVLDLRYRRVDTGSYQFGSWVTDVWGNTGVQFTESVIVPAPAGSG